MQLSLFVKHQRTNTYSCLVQVNVINWPFGLVVRFAPWMREVPGSIPKTAIVVVLTSGPCRHATRGSLPPAPTRACRVKKLWYYFPAECLFTDAVMCHIMTHFNTIMGSCWLCDTRHRRVSNPCGQSPVDL